MYSRERLEQTTDIYTAAISFLIELCQKKRVEKKLAMAEARRLIEEFSETQFLLERERMARTAARLGFDSLTTDTSDHRSSAWFKEFGRPFATGEANRCFALAVCHPQIGMGAAHLNTVTFKDTLRMLERFIDQPDPAQLEREIRQVKKGKLLGILVSQESLLATADSTVGLAFEEFGKLLVEEQRMPSEIIWAYGAGINYLTESEALLVGEHIISHVSDAASVLKGIKTGGEIKISLNLGTSSGVMYDGQKEPSFYCLKEA